MEDESEKWVKKSFYATFIISIAFITSIIFYVL